jgi:hypothetical protein
MVWLYRSPLPVGRNRRGIILYLRIVPSSEWALHAPSPAGECVPPPWNQMGGGHTRLRVSWQWKPETRRGGWGVSTLWVRVELKQPKNFVFFSVFLFPRASERMTAFPFSNFF